VNQIFKVKEGIMERKSNGIESKYGKIWINMRNMDEEGNW
jgi:hypothetical protein